MISRTPLHIAVVLALTVVFLFIILGFFGVGRAPSAGIPAPLTGPQGLLQEIARTGGVTALQKYQTAPGTGAGALPGDAVTVHYTGALPDGTVFDSSRTHGEPFSFVLGDGSVIQGWDQGFVGVTQGERFLLAIPPSLGYGGNAVGPIPPNSTLIFDIEVIDVSPQPQ